MGETTGIAWTDKTWNPWRGCAKVHPRCKFCYMFTEQTRYGQDPSVVVRTKTWADPIKWQKAALAKGITERVFTCSWSDWFHADADAWRDEAWAVVKQCPNLIFQILTKRPARIATHLPADWGEGYPNVWLGSSLDPDDKDGMAIFDVPATVRFLSLEPLIAPVNLDKILPTVEDVQKIYRGENTSHPPIHWIIVGGESGPGARPCHINWIRDILWTCQRSGVPVFVKQIGAHPVNDRDDTVRYRRDKKGGSMEEWPEDLRVRQFPNSLIHPKP